MIATVRILTWRMLMHKGLTWRLWPSATPRAPRHSVTDRTYTDCAKFNAAVCTTAHHLAASRQRVLTFVAGASCKHCASRSQIYHKQWCKRLHANNPNHTIIYMTSSGAGVVYCATVQSAALVTISPSMRSGTGTTPACQQTSTLCTDLLTGPNKTCATAPLRNVHSARTSRCRLCHRLTKCSPSHEL
jgi:hypothetical protein